MSFRIICLLSSALLLAACSEAPPEPQAGSIPEPVLSVPGVISIPGEQGFVEMEEEACEAILLYCWIPMGQYPEGESDLVFMASLDPVEITPVPVQFSSQVRNASQNLLNQMGIAMPVALGDDSLKAFMDITALPAAVLVTASGDVLRARGFGCAERLVRSLR
jgi:hypothetical protein